VFNRIIFCLGLCLLCLPRSGALQSGPSDFKIDGRLVDSATSQAIARGRVTIAPATQRNAFTTVITSEDGLFSFSGLKPGKYTLTAQARSYVFQAFNQHDQYSSSIAVGNGANSRGLVFRMAKENSIDGTITDETGEPLRDVQITVYQTGIAGGSQGIRVRTHGLTNDLGIYHVSHLPAGDYIISVEAMVWYAQRPQHLRAMVTGVYSSGGVLSSSTMFGQSDATSVSTEPETPNPLDVVYPLTFFPGVTDPGSASAIHLTCGEKYVADLVLQPVRAIHLELPGSGSPESSASYRLERKLPDGTNRAVTADITNLPSGEVEIMGIAPGQYTLITDLPNAVEPGTRRTSSKDAASFREINAVANDVVDEGKTRSLAAVTAKLLFDPGASVTKRSYLQLYDFKTKRNIYELIPENGEVEFKQNVPPGSYELSIYGAADAGSFIRSIAGTGAKMYGRTVVIKGATPVKLEISVGRNQGRITGVTLRDGQPLAGVMIVAVPNDPVHNRVLFRRDQSDSDGTFSLPSVVPGDYTLLAIENGWDLQWFKPEVLKPYLAQGEVLKVEQSGKYELKLKVQ
jgi:protocatechuate 3,4-dioxygenase beta subunit